MMKNQGFSMIELVMVIVLISVSAAIIAPRLMNSLPKTELKNAALELKFILWETQQRAIAEGKVCAVAFDTNEEEYSLHYCDDGPNFTADDTTGTIFYHSGYIVVGENVELDSTTFVREIYYDGDTLMSVRFNSLGEPNEGGSIVLEHEGSGATCTVTVSAITGRITMAMP